MVWPFAAERLFFSLFREHLLRWRAMLLCVRMNPWHDIKESNEKDVYRGRTYR